MEKQTSRCSNNNHIQQLAAFHFFPSHDLRLWPTGPKHLDLRVTDEHKFGGVYPPSNIGEIFPPREGQGVVHHLLPHGSQT